MRIIGGEFKRRLLATPPDAKTTRPMPDRVKEAVFNLLRGHFEGAVVFDAFAGVGTVGLEAISRGAERCVFVERDKKIAAILRQNIETLGVVDRADVAVSDALGAGALSRCPHGAHLVFFDPPYALMEDPARRERVLEQVGRCIARLDPAGFAVLRTPWPLYAGEPGERHTRETGDADLRIAGADGPETHEYGSMAVHLYAPSRQAAEGNPGEPEAGSARTL
jgi:16S rRNA (guanine(966)-N(2))-methyltransferase RsmD